MIDTAQREAAVAALGELLGAEATETLRRLLPTQPWRSVLPDSALYRPDVTAGVNDHRRRSLHTRLAEVVGPQHAATLMEYLPPLPWAELTDAGLLRRFVEVTRGNAGTG